MRRFLTVLTLVAGVITPATFASPAFAEGSDRPPPGVGIRLIDAPLATADDPRTRVYITDHVAPGTVIERRIEVSNGTDSPSEVSIYPAAADIHNGSFTGAENRTQNELSTWISVTPEARQLGPYKKARADVTITVPRNASSGERYGVVWAQTTTAPANGGVTQVNRVGIRIYLSIGPGGAPPSDFKITSLTAARDPDGAPIVQAAVRNTGKRALDLTAKLTLSDGPGGLSAGPFATNASTTLDLNETAPVTVVLNPQIPNGPWQAKITVTSGLNKHSAEATLTFPTEAGLGRSAPAQTNSGIPWWAIAVAILVLPLLLVLFLIRRSRDKDKDPADLADRATDSS